VPKTKEHKDRFLRPSGAHFPDPPFEDEIVDELSIRPRQQPSVGVVARRCPPDPRIALHAAGYGAVSMPLLWAGGQVPRQGGAA
jgi:hypothetical protein